MNQRRRKEFLSMTGYFRFSSERVNVQHRKSMFWGLSDVLAASVYVAVSVVFVDFVLVLSDFDSSPVSVSFTFSSKRRRGYDVEAGSGAVGAGEGGGGGRGAWKFWQVLFPEV